MLQRTLWLLLFALAASLRAQEPASSPNLQSLPAGAGSSGALPGKSSANSIQVSMEDPALREALIKWLAQPRAAISQETFDVKLIAPELQTALANRLEKETKKVEETGFAKFTQNGVAVAAVVGSLASGLVTGFMSLIATWIAHWKQEKRERKLLRERFEYEQKRDDKAADAALKRDEEAAKAAVKREQMFANREAEATRALEQLRADLAVADAVRQIRFERLQKFHAPLRALLQQTRGVADKLYYRIYDFRNFGAAHLANLHYYEEHSQDFANRTQTLALDEVYAPFLRILPPRAYILDAGCGSGRDSAAFLARSYETLAIDASPAMVRLAQILEVPAQVMTFQEMLYREEFDGIWACASLLHVPRIEIGAVLERFFTALKPGGILFASLKEGSGERIVEDGRFFAYYGLEEFKRVLEGGSWRVIEAARNFGGDGRAWLNYLAQRVSPQA